MAKDYYSILGMPRNATPEQIRDRFRELARTRHPDRFLGDERARAELEFQGISEAYNILSKPEKRRLHDLETARPEAAAQGTEGQRVSRLHLAAGIKLYREKNYVQAAEYFDRAAKSDPDSPQAWHHLAQACSHHRRYQQRGLAAIAKACELAPMDLTYLKLAGRLHAAAGLVDRADWYYNQAILWGGEDAAVRQALEDLRKSSKKGSWSPFGKAG